MGREKTVLIYSGGMDSTTLLYDLRQQGVEVSCLGVNYGQRHVKELQSAEAICQKLEVPYEMADLSSLQFLLGGSSQTNPMVPVPHGHYAAENMKVTVVPNRNMIMLAVAAGHAISIGAERVAYAAHAGDHYIYPDCRPEFISALEEALYLCHFTPIRLFTPYKRYTKARIAKVGHSLGVPFELTWSCYEGQDNPCGLCGTCQERILAFAHYGLVDPLHYRQPWEVLVAQARDMEKAHTDSLVKKALGQGPRT